MLRSSQPIIGEFGRYIVVGGVAFICDFLTLVGLTEFAGINYLISNAVGFSIGLTVNYLLAIHWVFNQRSKSSQRTEFVVFLLIGIVNLGLGEILLWFLVEHATLHYTVAKVVMTAFVFFSNFLLRKALLFHVA